MPTPRRPLILVAASPHANGAEFDDPSTSLSLRYTHALLEAGGLPWIFPPTPDTAALREAMARCDGVLLTGGDDIAARLHRPDADAGLAARCVGVDAGRDLFETALLGEWAARPVPMLAICRGLQVLNVALGGTLFVDLPTERPGEVRHNQTDLTDVPVHPVVVERGSLLARATGRRSLQVNSTHHQAVRDLAPGLRAVAVAPDGLVEAAEWADADERPWLVATQFHPERLAPRQPAFRRLFQAFIKACGGPGKGRIRRK
jgi:putative glutamine amidotransferase